MELVRNWFQGLAGADAENEPPANAITTQQNIQSTRSASKRLLRSSRVPEKVQTPTKCSVPSGKSMKRKSTGENDENRMPIGDMQYANHKRTRVETGVLFVSEKQSSCIVGQSNSSPDIIENNSEWTDQDLTKLKGLILAKLTEKVQPGEIVGQEDNLKAVCDLVTATVEKGESNSALIIGPRGAGKSATIRYALDKAGKSREFYEIRLSGSIHTDDRSTIRAIVRGLTFADDEIDLSNYRNFSESFMGVFNELKKRNKDRTVPIVIILDEFDLFTGHGKQGLLYNLFDTVQSSNNSLLVLGLASRYDVLDLLEKRVRSRFSHRQIFVLPPTKLEDYRRISINALKIDRNPDLSLAKVEQFNQRIDDFSNHPDFLKVTTRLFELERNVRSLLKLLVIVVSSLTADHPFPAGPLILEAYANQRIDSKARQLKEMSLLELCLVISMKKLMEQDVTAFNFEIVYDFYHQFTIQHNIGFRRAVAFKGFERLLTLEIIRPIETISKCPKEFQMVRLLMEPAQIKEAVLKSDSLPYVIKRWGIE